QAEDGIRDLIVTGVQTCALPISTRRSSFALGRVVWMTSCFNSDTVMLRNIARRWLLVRLSFLSPWRCRIFFSPCFDHEVRAVSRSEERRVGKEGRSRWVSYQ